MNANEIFPKVNPRLNRIKTISSFMRVIFILLLAFYSSIFLISWFGAVHQINTENITLNGGMIPQALFAILIQIGKVAQFWMAYKLFTCFNTGGWFNTKSIGWLRRIGFTTMIIWLLGLLVNFPSAWRRLGFDHIQYLPPMQQLREYVGFAVDCVSINTGLLTGFLLLVIAWIMDEGRKIQEEQELTV